MRLPGLILLLGVSAWAQVASDGVVTNVSRIVNIAPDEADFSVIVSGPLDTTQQQVTQIFLDSGIANPAVVSVAAGQNSFSYPPPTDSQMFYQIAFTAAPSALAGFAKKLDALRANLPPGLTGIQYTASLNASPAAVSAARQSVAAQLLADARSKAQSLATAASLTLGAIQGISETSYGTTGILTSLTTNVGAGVSSSTSVGGSGTQYTFYASVKFAVN
ncbi:MAG TPA: hypothetical protein VGH38_17065 [Bryobacteraceae bacterium]|jgi:hypothetical protein